MSSSPVREKNKSPKYEKEPVWKKLCNKSEDVNFNLNQIKGFAKVLDINIDMENKDEKKLFTELCKELNKSYKIFLELKKKKERKYDGKYSCKNEEDLTLIDQLTDFEDDDIFPDEDGYCFFLQ